MGLNLLPAALVAVGTGLFVGGAWWVYHPAALLLAGGALVGVGLVVDVGGKP